ncbi:MAG: glycosyltransferase family 39 protein, partial [Candidatus Omnitrophica bacterium]|nr:glycosyltransferase family 39 protein [Candidatus Omnitrophota bacterium]
MEEKKYIRYTFVLIAATTLIRMYLASITGLGVDEAHYVQYALKPALSYYDHPLLVSYLIRFFIVIIGKSLLSVRMPAIIAGIGTALLLFLIGRKLYGVQAGFWSVVLFNCIPLFSAIGGITVVPETILCLFYLALIFLTWQIYQTKNLYLWYFTGIITGLALLTKYTA